MFDDEPKKTVEERIAHIRRMMEMATELEAVRRKYGRSLATSDQVSVENPLGDLEVEFYGSFANAVEARIRHLEADRKQEEAKP